uniref:Reticulophagy regulator family member 2 n=1 Tax=Astyanax mexicanus TaxID=7994 RepID=A0A8B9KXZ9_ASTMX
LARRPSLSTSSVGLEELFPGGAEPGDPELARLRRRLQAWLSPHEAAVLGLQRLLVWERPVRSGAVALALNTAFWLLSSTSLRPLFLLSVSLLVLTLLERWKDKLPQITGKHSEESMSVQPRLLSVAELSHHLAESYLTCSLYVQEMLQFKRQNHGKFCAMTCSGCLMLAVVGHYVPGVMISYIILLSVLLWPLVVYHELIQKMYTGLEPILMKLDYSMKGDAQLRKHDKRKVKKEQDEGDEPRAETESESEEELSCFAPTVSFFSFSALADLDQQSVHSEPEESFSRDLPEFPSVDEFPSIEPGLFHFPLGVLGSGRSEGSSSEHQEDSQSPTSLLIQHLASPLHFVNTHFNGHGRSSGADRSSPGHGDQGGGASRVTQAPPRSLEALSEEIVSTAISTVVQNTLSALLRSTEASEAPSMAEFLPTETPPCPIESPLDSPLESPVAQEVSDEDVDVTAEVSTEEQPDVTLVPAEEEDFELLDQSELEQMDEGLGLGFDRQGTGGGGPLATDTPPSSQQQQADQQES